jgi:hypothetical protein
MHTHELVDYVAEAKTEKTPDNELIKACMSLWAEALSITEDSRKKGREAERFYKGDQWDDDTSRRLSSLDRAALTINEVAANIDTLRGYQIEQRTDIKYLPQEGGDQRVADMINVVVKRILDACYYAREESKVFKDQLVPGVGVFQVYMDHSENIEGEIKVKRFPWSDAAYGPHEDESLSDCEYGTLSRMMSLAKLKQMFPTKAKDIEASYMSYCGQYPDQNKSGNGVTGTNTDYEYATKVDDLPYTVDGSFPLVDVQKKQFRLVESWRKTYKEVSVIFNEEENFFFTAYDWKEEDVAAAATLPGFQTLTQLKTRMHVTRFCGNVVLSDENPADLPLHDFYTIPVYAYRQDGEFWGKVEVAKDPQRELNKRRSQVMDTINRLGASVYYKEPDTFTTPQEAERFKKNRSKPGSIFDVNDINRKPVLEEGAELPASMVNIMQMDQDNLQRLMNVIVQQEGANESNSLFLEKKKGRLTGNQFILDNLSFAKQKLGKIILALVSRYYTPERLERILNSQYSQQKFKVAGEDYSNFSKEEITEMLQSADLLAYDVIVTESSFAASTRLAIAQMLFELMSKGANIPPELPVEFMDVPADVRLRISESIQQQSAADQQSAKATSDSEITKTLIAKGQYTVAPDRAQELGLVPAANPDSALANGANDPNNEQSSTGDTNRADQLAAQWGGSLAQ